MNRDFSNISRKNNDGQEVDVEKLKRWIAVIVAIVLWGLSMKFSVTGFGNGVSKNDMWIGWLMALIITAIELIWNGQRDRTNLTLWSAGMACYIYGIYTNVVGLLYWQGNNFDKAWNNPSLWIFPICLGMFLEIVAEPLFIWGLTGNHLGGDFLGNLFGNKGIPNPDHNKNKKTVNDNLFSFGNKSKQESYNQTPQKQDQNKSKRIPQFADRPNSNKNQKPQQNQQQRRQEPSYDNHQQKPQNSASGRMSAIQKGPQNNDYLTQMKEEQEKWQKRGLYDHGLDELGMEKPDW